MHEPEFSWFLPTFGASVTFADPATARPATMEYLADVARTAEQSGFTTALVPVGDGCQDAWVVASLLAPQTERLKFLVAVRPGFVAPVVAAKMVATFDLLTRGRMVVNVVTGGFPAELAAEGDFEPHDARYRRTGEFIAVMKRYWTERAFDFEGEFYRVQGGRPFIRTHTSPYPPMYAGGASEAAEDLFAREVDCYLLWGETTAQMRERVRRMREKAAAHGRELRFGVRMHVLARATGDEAVRDAEALIAGVPEEHLARARAALTATDSAGESRQRAMAMPRPGDLWLEPNVWSGVGLVRRGVGVTVVGSYEQVARKFLAYTDLGLSFFILSGYPHLEEAANASNWMPRFYELLRERERALAAG